MPLPPVLLKIDILKLFEDVLLFTYLIRCKNRPRYRSYGDVKFSKYCTSKIFPLSCSISESPSDSGSSLTTFQYVHFGNIIATEIAKYLPNF